MERRLYCKQDCFTRSKLYVLTNKSLDPIYACVQGGHVVAQWLLDHPEQNWNNSYLIYLSADVEKWVEKLSRRDCDFSVFREPDLDNEITAIAIESDGKMFKNLKLVA